MYIFEALCYFVAFIFVCITGLIVHFQLLRRRKPPRNSKSFSAPLRLMVILGSGGHTTELLKLLQTMSVKKYNPVTFVLAESDTTSVSRVNLLERVDEDAETKVKFVRIPRSREVLQSWLSSFVTTVNAVMFAFPVVFREQPDVVLLLRRTVMIFVESVCRVKTLSLTGKILYYIVDLFFVQYSYLKDNYPNAIYVGRVV